MYTFVDFTSQIVGRRGGVPCPTNKGVSYTNLVCWLGCDLKNRLFADFMPQVRSCWDLNPQPVLFKPKGLPMQREV